MRSNNTIYSLHTHPEGSGLLHIETVITAGIYNFSILGISAKHSTDVKHKVYTALRSEGVVNLKSDNRKITTNIMSNKEDIVPLHAELAIAVSCAECISENIIHFPILAIGGLSITGNIVPSNKLLSAIRLAVREKIKRIVCSVVDISAIHLQYLEYAKASGIEFITGTTIRDVIDNIRKDLFYPIQQPQSPASPYLPQQLIQETLSVLRTSHILWSLFVAVCGRHSIIIETDNSPFIEEAADFIVKLVPAESIERQLDLIYKTNYDDSTFQKQIYRPSYTKIASHTSRKTILDPLSSCAFIEHILSVHADVVAQCYQESDILTISTCAYCPCGNKGLLNKKCLCLQRNILRYQHKLNADHKYHYTLWVSHHTESQHPLPILDDTRYVTYIIQIIRSNTETASLDTKAQKMYTQLSENLNMHQKSKLISLATTLQCIHDLEEGVADHTKRPTLISTKNLLLAFSYLPRMDF